jgi:hypothetical protein
MITTTPTTIHINLKPKNMKKTLLIMLALVPFLSRAQDTSIPKEEKYYVFSEIVGTGRLLSTKVDVEIDYGQETKFFSADNNRIMDERTGKPKKFNSMVDAMNFMGALNWDFVQAYVVTESGQNVYHWLMKREIRGTEMDKHLPTIRKDLTKQ